LQALNKDYKVPLEHLKSNESAEMHFFRPAAGYYRVEKKQDSTKGKK